MAEPLKPDVAKTEQKHFSYDDVSGSLPTEKSPTQGGRQGDTYSGGNEADDKKGGIMPLTGASSADRMNPQTEKVWQMGEGPLGAKPGDGRQGETKTGPNEADSLKVKQAKEGSYGGGGSTPESNQQTVNLNSELSDKEDKKMADDKIAKRSPPEEADVTQGQKQGAFESNKGAAEKKGASDEKKGEKKLSKEDMKKLEDRQKKLDEQEEKLNEEELKLTEKESGLATEKEKEGFIQERKKFQEKRVKHEDERKKLAEERGDEGEEGQKGAAGEEPGVRHNVPVPADWNAMYPPRQAFAPLDEDGNPIDPNDPNNADGKNRVGYNVDHMANVTANPGTNPGTAYRTPLQTPQIEPPAPTLKP